MKKILIVLLAITLLSACGSPSQEVVEENERFGDSYTNSGAKVITDNETGCKYLFIRVSQAGGLSPLYNENGEIVCNK